MCSFDSSLFIFLFRLLSRSLSLPNIYIHPYHTSERARPPLSLHRLGPRVPPPLLLSLSLSLIGALSPLPPPPRRTAPHPDKNTDKSHMILLVLKTPGFWIRIRPVDTDTAPIPPLRMCGPSPRKCTKKREKKDLQVPPA